MRCGLLRKGYGLAGRLRLLVVGCLLGERAPDVLRVIFHRPRFFGMHFASSLQRALRGPSRWSIGERELFAAFVSAKNRCPF